MANPAGPPLLVITGPTAVGKSALALEVAQAWGGEILCADSAAVYRGMDVGADKPDPEARRRVPHHLLDLAGPAEQLTLAQWLEAARRALVQVQGAGRVPLLVGGTGLYIRALLEGYDLSAPPPDPTLRARLERMVRRFGAPRVHARLRRRLAPYLESIRPQDARRVIRALERAWAGLPPPRPIPYRPPPGVWVVELERPRADLYRRIDRRAAAQWAGGRLVAEAQAALALGAVPGRGALAGLGYRHAAEWLRGRLSREEALRLTQRDTRHLAKRQLTFWRGVPWVLRLSAEAGPAGLQRLLRAAAGDVAWP